MPASQQLQAAIWGVGVGIGLFFLIYFVVRSGWFRKAGNGVVPAEDVTPDAQGPVHHYPEELAEAHGPVPLVLKILIVGYLVFLAGYVYFYFQAMNGPLAAFDKFLTQ